MVYANTSAAVKARADWVVTSSIALKVVEYLKNRGEKILWAPDKYLGDYVRRQTGADVLLWQGACVVHEEFKAKQLAEQHKIPFYYHDFREGWQQGIDMSKDMGLYRQSYCGCIYSEQERYDTHFRKRKGKKG